MQRTNMALITSDAGLIPATVTHHQASVHDQHSGRPRIRGEMSPALVYILQEAQRELGFGLSHNLGGEDLRLGSSEGRTGNRIEIINRVAERLGFTLSPYERDEVLSHLEQETKPFGILQALVDNPQISDIIVSSYSKVSVQQGRRNFSTDLSFPNQEVYEAFVERLLQRAGANYSTRTPISDGMIGAYARIHAVHRSLCESGPYLTIRLNRYAAVEIEDLVRNGMAPRAVFDYLRAIVHTGQTLLLVGEVGTGKTTLSRALAGSIPIDESILVIEDTPEIRLQHPHVRYVRTRIENSDGAGRVTPQECIRGGMRMAMNRIIFGEIRDAEAAEAFVDVCASGHPGISTIHARSAGEATTRLELFLGRAQKGVGRAVLSEQIVTAVQVIVFVDYCRQTGQRRIYEVKEIGPVADGVIRQRDIFRYQVVDGAPTWRVLNKVSAHRDLIEGLSVPVSLSALPGTLELSEEVGFREAAQSRNR